MSTATKSERDLALRAVLGCQEIGARLAHELPLKTQPEPELSPKATRYLVEAIRALLLREAAGERLRANSSEQAAHSESEVPAA